MIDTHRDRAAKALGAMVTDRWANEVLDLLDRYPTVAAALADHICHRNHVFSVVPTAADYMAELRLDRPASVCGCGEATYRPEDMGTRRAARRCSGCHRTVAHCRCSPR